MTRARLPSVSVGRPGRPVLYVLYALLLVVVQGALSRLLGGSPVPPPTSSC